MAYDAILIACGGLNEDGTLNSWSKARFDKALSQFTGTEILIPMARYTLHKPPKRDKEEYPLIEAQVAANYLMSQGVPGDKILLEDFSYDTVGNFYFARLLHIDPLKLQRILIVTSKTHMPRSKLLAEWIFSLTPQAVNYELDFLEAEDLGMSQAQQEARWKREQHSIMQKKEVEIPRIKTLKQFHHWLYSQHEAYAAHLQFKKASKEEQESY